MRTRKHNIMYGGQYLGHQGSSPPGTPKYVPTVSYVHTCVDEVHKGPPYRTGGPLYVEKTAQRIGFTAPVVTRKISVPTYYYAGRFQCPPPSVTLDSERSIAGLGAEGFSRSIPVSPILSLGVAIGELKDMPRMLLQTEAFFRRMMSSGLKMSKTPKKVRDVKNAGWSTSNLGSDYLNLNFGWVPFLKDLFGVFTFQQALARKLAALKKGNKKRIRRRRVLRSEQWSADIAVSQPAYTSLAPILPASAYPSGASELRTLKKRYNRQVWFSAEFTYYIPELEDPNADLTRLKMDLLGLALDPEVIYNLIPWSWLLDWFTNTGTIVHNAVLMHRYHVVARYAYVMQSEKIEYIQSGTHDMYIGTSPNQEIKRLTAESSLERVYRRREEASPYGFGIADSSLTGYQWSILIALGLTRLR